MSQPPLNIYISEKADADEKRIYKYILRKFGKMYADKLRSNINDLYRKLSSTPNGRPHS